jgi:hypothetical protein
LLRDAAGLLNFNLFRHRYKAKARDAIHSQAQATEYRINQSQQKNAVNSAVEGEERILDKIVVFDQLKSGIGRLQ